MLHLMTPTKPFAVAESLLNHIALAALNEADEFHLTAAARALQRVDFVHPLDEVHYN